MGQKSSKDEMVYQQVVEGNVDAIKALSTQGARLEWIDKEGKTPLIVASMDPRLYIVAKTLIQLGANLNSYRPGRQAGTPLHHAAKRGLHNNVKLLLSSGADPFLRNDDCQTPLDVARMKGHLSVVRAIEDHLSYFSGYMREIMVVPGILEQFVPQGLSRKRSRKCWVAVVPCSQPDPTKPPKIELAVYNSPQVPHPRTVISLWKCNIAEPKFQDSDPALVIVDESNGTRYKFLSAIEGERRQLPQLFKACKGLPEVTPPFLQSDNGASSSPNEATDLPLVNIHPANPSVSVSQSSINEYGTNGWGDVGSSASHNGWGPPNIPPTSKASTSTSGLSEQSATDEYNGWGPPIPATTTQSTYIGSQVSNLPTPESSVPSAPPIPGDFIDEGPIHYPIVESNPVEVGGPSEQGKSEAGSCVICWDAPVEGVCIPCGHMAGCMSCLTEIKSKKGDCPVCRAKIDQVIRVYAV